jgi:hypothetical protein
VISDYDVVDYSNVIDFESIEANGGSAPDQMNFTTNEVNVNMTATDYLLSLVITKAGYITTPYTITIKDGHIVNSIATCHN